MFDEETDHFISGDRDDSSSRREYVSRGCLSWNRTLVLSLSANALLLTLCILLSGTLFSSTLKSSWRNISTVHPDGLSGPYSPANTIIEYEYRALIPNDTRFTGHPGTEWENSIHDVMAGTLIRILADEMKLSGSDSIPLKDGGYAAGLGVAHNLHCMKQIKQFIYKEHFYADFQPGNPKFDYAQSHADHCLDFIRQSIMCHVDYSLYTLTGAPASRTTHRIPGIQKCVSWHELHVWMLERQASTDMLLGP